MGVVLIKWVWLKIFRALRVHLISYNSTILKFLDPPLIMRSMTLPFECISVNIKN